MADQVDSTSTEAAMHSASPGAAGAPSLTSRYLGLIRFSHTIFALPFAALACVFALVVPFTASTLTPVTIAIRLVGVLVCMVSARSAAMAFNRLVDAQIDAANPRTASRHLPAGLLTAMQVWSFFLITAGVFLGACLLFLPNWLPIALAIPVLAWICGYSFAKRFTAAAHLWLGMALAMSPLCAWVAIRGEEVISHPSDMLPAVWLALAIAFWVAGFDIIYACQDADFDRRLGLHSIPARLGVAGGLRLAAGLHLLMLIVLARLPLYSQLSLGWLYYAGLLVVAGLVVRQHMLVSPTDLGRVNVAFFNINAMISFGLSLVAGLDAYLG